MTATNTTQKDKPRRVQVVLPSTTADLVEGLRKAEDRTSSKMCGILIKEALQARGVSQAKA